MTQSNKGFLALILASVLFGMYGIYSRLIGIEFGAFNQNWIKNLLIILILGSYLVTTKSKFPRPSKNILKWLIIWTIPSAFIMVALFSSFNKIPIGTSYFLLYSSMIGTGLLAGKILFKEKFTSIKLLATILALIGLTLIYTVEIEKEKTIYALMAIGGGVLSGLYTVVSKKVSKIYSALQLTMIDSLVSLVITFIGSRIIQESLPSISFNLTWLVLIFFAVTQIIASAFTIIGFRLLEAQIASIITPIEIVFAVIFAYLFFNETLTPVTLFGGLLIASGAILPNLKQVLDSKLNSQHNQEAKNN